MGVRRPAKYWLTTQWAHPHDGSLPYYIYLQPQHETANRKVQAGDGVLFYELRGPAPSWAYPNAPVGRQAIVAVAEVGGEYGNRSRLPEDNPFKREAPCVRHSSAGIVPRKQVNEVLGFKPTYNLFGFGRGSGIRELTPEEFQKLAGKLMRQS